LGVEISGFRNAKEAQQFKQAVTADAPKYLLVRMRTRPQIVCEHTEGVRGHEVPGAGGGSFEGRPEGFFYTIELNRVYDVKLVTKAMELFPQISTHLLASAGQ